MRLNDPNVVRREYATEDGLLARMSAYAGVAGLRTPELAFQAVVEAAPTRVLEVGCGWGELSARIASELRADVVALDLSPRMVELARRRGVAAQTGDVQALSFGDGEFDCAVANWMLYHVPDLERGLSELARVLVAGGRLVAATNGLQHLGELWSLVGRDRAREPVRFFAENGEASLRRHFAHVERRDVEQPITFAGVDAVRHYIASSVAHKHLATEVPDFDGPLVATSRQVVFVAEKAG